MDGDEWEKRRVGREPHYKKTKPHQKKMWEKSRMPRDGQIKKEGYKNVRNSRIYR